MIVAENIQVKAAGATLLNAVSCKLRPGITCVLGANGAGKSTLLKCLSGGIAVDDGAVLFDGKPIGEWSAKALARRRAVLGQNLEVSFPFTALDIVMMGRAPYATTHLGRHDDEVASQALHQVDAYGLKARTYTSLSGGEKQRVQLARALAQLDFTENSLTDKYLFLDEPTSAMDIKYQRLFKETVLALADKGLAIFCILHDINVSCDIADQLLMMKAGRLLATQETTTAQTPSASTLRTVYDIDLLKTHDAARGKTFYWV